MNDADWWLSSVKMTIWVSVRNGTVIDSAPIARKFIGQPMDNLRQWMRRQGAYFEERCSPTSREKP